MWKDLPLRIEEDCLTLTEMVNGLVTLMMLGLESCSNVTRSIFNIQKSGMNLPLYAWLQRSSTEGKGSVMNLFEFSK
jgi:hypothetical protein